MNLQSTKLKNPGCQSSVIVAALLIMAAQASQVVAEENGYALRMLDSPSEAVLSAEANGRVTIYDGLYSETIDRALDQQFERIDSMMFIGTQHRQKEGDHEADDDC